MILFDNLDRERKTLSFTALRMILVCEACVLFFHLLPTIMLQENAANVPKMLIIVSTDRLTD